MSQEAALDADAFPCGVKDRSRRLAVVAMSGGVDSSLAAALMAEEGWRAVGVTLKLIPGQATGFGCCGSPADIDDAKRVCEALGMAHYTLDLARLFEDKVIKPFVEAYAAARTPNPCVDCNRSLKFGYLLGLAEAWGASCVATGHYARVQDGRLFMARDALKDQTYFLYGLTPRELGKVRFPVGGLEKSEVRRRARALGLKTADKPESQEICFVPRRDYRGFLKSRLGASQAPVGSIKDTSGRVLGEHSGLSAFTIGQRRGLGLSGGDPRYVVRLELRTNTVVVGGPTETFRSSIVVREVTWTGKPGPSRFGASVRIRHRHPPAGASLSLLGGDAVAVTFDEPQRAAAPGQAAVFYAGDEVLGGGTIASTEEP